MKNTKAEPRAVPRKGINKAMKTGLMLDVFLKAKFGIFPKSQNPYYWLFPNLLLPVEPVVFEPLADGFVIGLEKAVCHDNGHEDDTDRHGNVLP